MEDDDAEEGQVSSDSREEEGTDSEGDWVLRAALPVAPMDEAFDPQATPVSGEEYLRLVRYHDSLLPSAQSSGDASIPEGLIDVQFTGPEEPALIIAATAKDRLPTLEWISGFMSVFAQGCPTDSDLEDDGDVCEAWPSLGDEQGWRHHMYGPTSSTDSTPSPPPPPKRLKPTPLEVDYFHLARPSQRQLMQLVKYHIRWFDDLFSTNAQRVYQWIIRLFQVLDPRVTSNQISILRQLALRALVLRRDHPATAADDSTLFYLNGIIVIIAKRFGQLDLLLS